MKPISLTIQFPDRIKIKGSDCDGGCVRDGEKYIISIRKGLSVYDKIGVLFHEFTHFVLLVFFNDVFSQEIEEKVCNSVETIAKRDVINIIYRKNTLN